MYLCYTSTCKVPCLSVKWIFYDILYYWMSAVVNDGFKNPIDSLKHLLLSI